MASSRTIPSLDGLRALSVFLVVIGHESYAPLNRLPSGIFGNGALGVNIFFVISGFLITHLMLSEQDKTGKLDVQKFYVRRAFRIFPAYYAYLAVVAIASVIHLYPVDWKTFLGAATYTLNYFSQPRAWVVAHSWSLCIEEQFYILWPACIALLPRKTCLRIAGLIVVLSPLIRIATYYADRARLSSISFMSYTRSDALMVGCFIALAISTRQFGRMLHVFKLPAVAAFAGVILFFVSPYYSNRFRLSMGFTVDAICGGAVLLYAMSHSESVFGRILNQKTVKHFGVISYSLYLWQQFFTGPNTRFPLWNLFAILACAEISYWCIERPSLRLRDHYFRSKVAAHEDRMVVQQIDEV
jgi:peptidoglycan/LPS O-acetylase OafA/YrhL